MKVVFVRNLTISIEQCRPPMTFEAKFLLTYLSVAEPGCYGASANDLSPFK